MHSAWESVKVGMELSRDIDIKENPYLDTTQPLPMWKKLSLFAVTWPIFIDSVLRMMLGTADVFMLSRISDQAAGAIGLANEIIAFCILMFGFVGIGTSVAVTQYLGAGKPETASRVSALAITMNLIFGLVVSAVIAGLGEQVMRLMHLDSALIGVANRYLMIIGAFLWVEAVSYAVSSIIRAHGYTRDVMYVTLGVNIVHVTGNYLLIFGHFGFPELGVTGAAISTVVCRMIGLAVLLVLLYRRVSSPIRLKDYADFDKTRVKQVLSIGLPAAGEHLAWQSQYMMIMSFINIIGQTALSAHIYVYNVSAYFMALAMAIGMGTEIIVGHMVGAGELQAAYRRLLRSLRISLLLTFRRRCRGRLVPRRADRPVYGQSRDYCRRLGDFSAVDRSGARQNIQPRRHQLAARRRRCPVPRAYGRDVDVGSVRAACLLARNPLANGAARHLDSIRCGRMAAGDIDAHSLAQPGLGEESAR